MNITGAAKKGVEDLAHKINIMDALTNFAVRKIRFDKRAAWILEQVRGLGGPAYLGRLD